MTVTSKKIDSTDKFTPKFSKTILFTFLGQPEARGQNLKLLT